VLIIDSTPGIVNAATHLSTSALLNSSGNYSLDTLAPPQSPISTYMTTGFNQHLFTWTR
jgi:hypothetical protein